MGAPHRAAQPVSRARTFTGLPRPRPLLPSERRASEPWTPPYEYECTGGHGIGSDRPVDACPAFVLGERCAGTLRRFGRGSGRGSNLNVTATA